MKITLLSGKTFEINADLGFDMKIIHPGRSRRLSLRIDKKERVAVLTIPKYCSRKKAVSFVESHQDWVLDNLRKIPELKIFQVLNSASVKEAQYSEVLHQRTSSFFWGLFSLTLWGGCERRGWETAGLTSPLHRSPHADSV